MKRCAAVAAAKSTLFYTQVFAAPTNTNNTKLI